MTLQEAKDIQIRAIDENTGYLISKGFSFAGFMFSLSTNAQINWSNIMQLPDVFFPINVKTMDEQVYSLALANQLNFYLSAVNGKNVHLQSGTVLVQEIEAMTDIDEVLNFSDPRLV